MLYVCILLIFVFFAGLAMTIGEGLWSNAVNLLCILISIPTGYIVGLPLGSWGFEQMDTANENYWYFTFAGMWLAFFVSMLLLRVFCDKISKVRMRFIPQLEMIAGPLVGLIVAIMFTSYLSFTIFAGPMAAGVWNVKAAEGWQTTTLSRLVSPSLSVVQAAGGDVSNLK